MPGIARLGDRTTGTCSCHASPISVGGTITTGSPDVFVNSKAVAREGDTVTADCGHIGIIVTYSPDTFANNRAVARLGDTTSGCYVATIIEASSDSFDN